MKKVETFVVVAMLLAGLVMATLSQAATSSDERIERRTVGKGQYVVVMPEEGPVKEPMATLFFYHGYGQSADLVLNNKALLKTVSDKNVMLVIPDGLNRSWSNVGAPSERRDEIAFTKEILRDIQKSKAVDQNRLWASGFSLGGSMAWDVACYMGEEFSAFFPIAGSFWRPHPVSCETPVNIRHIHGLSDRVVPMTGRAIGTRWHQGDVRQGIAIWQDANGCEVKPEEVSLTDMTCDVWRNCGSGKTMELCLHKGGHNIKSQWIAKGIDWAENL